MNKFVHLHVHSHYSLLDGLGKIPDLVNRAKEMGMDSLALTDHGVLYGAIEFYEAAKKAGIKPIIGVETYIAPRTIEDRVPKIDTAPYHLVLLAQNFQGYQNLLKLVSIAHIDGYYYKPRIDKKILAKYSEGLIALSACLGGEVAHYAAYGNIEAAEKSLLEYLEIFGKDRFFLELQDHPQLPKQDIANKALIELAKKHKVGLVATNDVHYINKDDAEAQDVLLCIQTGRFLSEQDRMSMKVNGEFLDISFRSPEEMAERFKDVPEAITNTGKIADSCNLEIEIGKFRFPSFQVPKGEDYETHLKKLIDERLPKVVPNITDEIKKRIDYEFQVIKDKGYLGYFLIVQDFVHWAKDNAIPTNTRGSAAGCFISYALGITSPKLNPLDYNLPFERFLNPFRPSAPDIDIDIADSGRDDLIQYVSEKYGKDHVAQICTFGTMAAKAAIRDVARVLSFPYEFGDTLSKLVPLSTQTHYIGIKKSIEMVPELKQRYKNDPDTKRTLDLACRLEGCARHASVHAAGVVIAPDEITKFTPIMKDTKGDRLVTQYEMHTVGEDGVGLIKMDFLGLANLTIIQQVLRIIRKTRNIDLKLDDIPVDDPKAFDLLAKGETVGVFQLESEGMRRYIKELKPTTIHDIMAMVALYRPGPMNFIPEYIIRKHNPSKIKYLDPRMEKILEKSLGLIVYQDDVLMIAIELAGYNWQEVDKFRKAIGKKIVSEMAAQKEKFFKQIIERGMRPEIATELWNQIETFAGYGFNKAHAASYGLVAYQTAYLKAHFPSEYMAAWLTSEQHRDIEKVAFALQEAERMKITVIPPDVNKSFVDFGVIPETWEISYALASIKNVGRGVADAIVEERKKNGPFKTLEDFAGRLGTTVINKKVVEALAKAGALDEFGERGQLLLGTDAILKFAANAEKQASSNQLGLFGSTPIADQQVKIPLPDSFQEDKKQNLAWEKEFLGIYLSDHPLKDLQTKLPLIATPIKDLTPDSANQRVRVAGLIVTAKKILTKNNQPMIFIKLDDNTGKIEAVVFPKLYETVVSVCQPDNLVVIEGKVNLRDGEIKMAADSIDEIGEQISFDELEMKHRTLKDRGNYTSFKKRSKADSDETKTQDPPPPPKPEEPPLTITLNKESNKKTLDSIREILESFPGQNPVILRIPQNSHFREIKTRAKVSPTEELITSLANLVGQNQIAAPVQQ